MAVVTLLVIAGIVMVIDNLKPRTSATAATLTPTTTITPSSSQPTTTAQTPAATSPAATTTTSSGYKDGTYSASTSYYVPRGYESIKVTLTLSNGVITNASVQNSENDPTSAQYQEDFAAMYKHAVVGRKVSSLQVGVIAGASDTTLGFNDAVSRIATQAQA